MRALKGTAGQSIKAMAFFLYSMLTFVFMVGVAFGSATLSSGTDSQEMRVLKNSPGSGLPGTYSFETHESSSSSVSVSPRTPAFKTQVSDPGNVSPETSTNETQLPNISPGSVSPGTHQSENFNESVLHRTPTLNTLSAATQDPSCYILNSFLEMTVSPPPKNSDTVKRGYLYTPGTIVYVTCQPSKTFLDNSTVFIHSCRGREPWSAATFGTSTLMVTSSTPSKYWLACWQVDSSCSQNAQPDQFEPDVLACAFCSCDSKTLVFDFSPAEPILTRCESYDWSGLKCIWTVDDTLRTNWTVSYWPPLSVLPNSGCESKWYLCETNRVSGNDNKTLTCEVDQNCFIRDATFTFTLLGVNGFGEAMRNFSVKSNLSIVKLSPVKSLNVTTIAHVSSALSLKWAVPERADGMTYLACQIQIAPAENKEKAELFTLSETNCSSGELTLYSLHPYTEYIVQMQIKAKDSSYWSDTVEKRETTPEDVPSGAPEVTAGGHVLWQCEEEYCLVMYWKPPPQDQWNGILSAFNLTVTTESGQLSSDHEIPNQISQLTDGQAVSMSIRDVSLTSNATQKVCISASTSVGFSNLSGCVILPSRTDSTVPSAPGEVIVESIINVDGNNASYLVTWSIQNNTADYVTIFWCGAPRYYPDVIHVACQTDMNWIHLSTNTSSYELDLQYMPAHRQGLIWYFGVSTISQNLSWGITWNGCIYDFNGVSSPPSLIASDVMENQFTVAWDFTLCDVNFLRGRPLKYQIFYRLSRPDTGVKQCTGGQQLDLIPDQKLKSATVNELKPGSTYYVCMRIVTRTNQSEVSEPLVVHLQQPDGGDSTYLPVIVSVAIVSTTIVIIVVVVCLRRIKARSKKIPANKDWKRQRQTPRTPPLPSTTFQIEHTDSTVPGDTYRVSNGSASAESSENCDDSRKLITQTDARVKVTCERGTPSNGYIQPVTERDSGFEYVQAIKVADGKTLNTFGQTGHTQTARNQVESFSNNETQNGYVYTNSDRVEMEMTSNYSSRCGYVQTITGLGGTSPNSSSQTGYVQTITGEVQISVNNSNQTGYVQTITGEVQMSSNNSNQIGYVHATTDEVQISSNNSSQTGYAHATTEEVQMSSNNSNQTEYAQAITDEVQMSSNNSNQTGYIQTITGEVQMSSNNSNQTGYAHATIDEVQMSSNNSNQTEYAHATIDEVQMSSNNSNQTGYVQTTTDEVQMSSNNSNQTGYVQTTADELQMSSNNSNQTGYVQTTTDEVQMSTNNSKQTGYVQTITGEVQMYSNNSNQTGYVQTITGEVQMYSNNSNQTGHIWDSQEPISHPPVDDDTLCTPCYVKVSSSPLKEQQESEPRLPDTQQTHVAGNLGTCRPMHVMAATHIGEESILNSNYIHLNGLSDNLELQNRSLSGKLENSAIIQ